MPYTRPTKLDPPVDPARDHLLGDENAELALVEYGNYTRDSCHAAHEVIAGLRDRFGSRMRYVFRHRPAGENNSAVRAAELAEFASATTGQFWPMHDALMKRGPAISVSDLEEIAREFNLPSRDGEHAAAFETARRRVQEDRQSAKRSGVIVTPTFFIDGRRYDRRPCLDLEAVARPPGLDHLRPNTSMATWRSSAAWYAL